jgi:hypothetical protein
MGIKKIVTEYFTEQQRKKQVEKEALENRQKLLTLNKQQQLPAPVKINSEDRYSMKEKVKKMRPEYTKDDTGYNMFQRLTQVFSSEQQQYITVRFPVTFKSDNIAGSPYITLNCQYFPDATCVVLGDDALEDAQVLIDYVVCVALDIVGRVPKPREIKGKDIKMIKCSFKVPSELVKGGPVWFRK